VRGRQQLAIHNEHAKVIATDYFRYEHRRARFARTLEGVADLARVLHADAHAAAHASIVGLNDHGVTDARCSLDGIIRFVDALVARIR
jgi:hypothetical protein